VKPAWDRAGRETQYAEHAKILDDMAALRRAHERDEPGCTAAPLCMGREALDATMAYAGKDSGFLLMLVLTAVGEISRRDAAMADLRGRLEARRELADESLAVVGTMEATINRLGEELDEARLLAAGLQDELDAWDALADVIGPVIPPVEED